MNTSNNRDINGLVRVHYEHCDSTQTRTQHILSKIKPKEGLVVSSDFQSQGKGQHGSKWNSSNGMNLTMSMYINPLQLNVEQQFLLNIWSSLALVSTLEKYLFSEAIKVKWPNDVLVNNRKIAGVIIQSSLQGNKIQDVILGVGINVNECMKSYPFTATSLRDELNARISLGNFREQVIGEIQKFYLNGIQFLDFNSHRRAYVERLWKYNQKVTFIEKRQEKVGVIKGIDEHGQLLLQSDNERIRTLKRKEVEFILN